MAIESTARLVIAGEPAGPRPVVGDEVAAVDFDDYAGVTLVDTTPEAGDAVATAAGDPEAGSWLLFRAADLTGGASRLTVRVSRTAPGVAALELRADNPATGRLLATIPIPSTAHRYAWTTATAEVTAPTGIHDLYVVLQGHLRLATFRLE
jgi:beta-glucosidase